MVLNLLAVPLLNSVQESRKLLLVVKVQLGHDLGYRVDHVQSQVLQALVPSNFVAELKDVKFPFMCLFENLFFGLDLVDHSFDALTLLHLETGQVINSRDRRVDIARSGVCSFNEVSTNFLHR